MDNWWNRPVSRRIEGLDDYDIHEAKSTLEHLHVPYELRERGLVLLNTAFREPIMNRRHYPNSKANDYNCRGLRTG